MDNSTPAGAGWLLDEFDADDFWSRVSFTGGTDYADDPLVDTAKVAGQCWRWNGALTTNDGDYPYGTFSVWGRKNQAHRIAYRDFGHALGDDLVIDHLCRNTLCVRPSHLEPVTHTENIRRGALPLLNRKACRNGHPVTDDNIVRRKTKNGGVNACKTCLAASKHKSYVKRKEAGSA